MDGQNVQNAPAGPSDKAAMPAWGWIVIIVLVAVVVALIMLKSQPQPQPLEQGTQAPAATTPSVGAPETVAPTQPAVTGSGAAAKPVSQPVNFDSELKDLDSQANSVSENNFNEGDLSDANVGL